MIYVANITIPKGTSANQAVCERVKISLGLIYKIELQFPPGCGGLAHIVINDGGYQVWPSTPDSNFATDDYTISFEDTYLKQVDPSELQIYGYNEDETYPHTIQVRIGVAAKYEFMARYLPTMTYDYFMKLMEKKEAEEREKTSKILAAPFAYLTPGED